MSKAEKIGLIGGGKMGGVLAGGIVSGGLAPASQVIVADVDRDRLQELAKTLGVETTADNREAAKASRILILAVKPQTMAEVLSGLAGEDRRGVTTDENQSIHHGRDHRGEHEQDDHTED